MGMRLKIHNNFILAVCALLLAVICFLSVRRPMAFDEERVKREAAVKTRLVAIRLAQERYRKATGTYSPDLATLVRKGYMADSLRFVPYSDGETFSLNTTVTSLKSGRDVPLMECGAQYDQYLKGLDDNSIANLIDNASSTGRYPGLKIGDLITPNNNAGNWE